MQDHSWEHRVSLILVDAMKAAIKQWNSVAMKNILEDKTTEDSVKIRAAIMTMLTTEYADKIIGVVEQHFGTKSSK